MSRGLGRLQRFIKERIYRAGREYRREVVAIKGRSRFKRDPNFDSLDEGVKRFTVCWWDVRQWVEGNPDFNRGPYRISGPSDSIEPIMVGPSGPIWFPRISPALERSAKRALHTLVKRGEVACLRGGAGYLHRYVTPETKRSLDETGKAIMEGFARMEAEGRLP
jgi:hypothetical protein